MEHQPWKLVLIAERLVDAPLAIAAVTDDLVCEVVKVTADLVATTRVEKRPDQSAVSEFRDLLEFGP